MSRGLRQIHRRGEPRDYGGFRVKWIKGSREVSELEIDFARFGSRGPRPGSRRVVAGGNAAAGCKRRDGDHVGAAPVAKKRPRQVDGCDLSLPAGRPRRVAVGPDGGAAEPDPDHDGLRPT